MKKIAFYIPLLNIGGAERVVLDLLKQFAFEQKYIVYLISDIEHSILKDQVPEGVNVINFLDRQKFGIIRKIYSLSDILKKYNIDILISNLTHANVHSLLSKVFFGWGATKCLIVEHSVLTEYLKNKKSVKHYVLGIFTKLLYRRADKIVCVSNYVREDLYNHCNIDNKKALVIYNPIDSEKIDDQKNEIVSNQVVDFCANYKIIIVIGRLEKAKNQILALKTISKLNPKYRIIFVGDGSERKYLENYVVENELSNSVLFVGHQKNPYKFLNYADILLLPSLFEGFGIVLIEALYLQKQIVSVDIPTSREILQNGNFGFISKANPESIVNSIVQAEISPINTHILNEQAKSFKLLNVYRNYENLIDDTLRVL